MPDSSTAGNSDGLERSRFGAGPIGWWRWRRELKRKRHSDRHWAEVADRKELAADRVARAIEGRLDFWEEPFGASGWQDFMIGLWREREARVAVLARALDLSPAAIERTLDIKKWRWISQLHDREEREAAVVAAFQRIADLEAQVHERGRQLVEVRDWRTAEEIAARHMRENGWPDACVTARGADIGIDVAANGAVAQVKWFTGKARVGRPVLQQLRGGALTTRSEALFFANADAGGGRPYTAQAVEWASENGVRLHTISSFGHVASLESPDQ